MQRIEIKPGTQYGELKVLRDAPDVKGKRHMFCKCSCGQQVSVRLGHLRSGHSTKCGRCGITYKGRQLNIGQWAREFNINESTLRARLKTMSIGEALKMG